MRIPDIAVRNQWAARQYRFDGFCLDLDRGSLRRGDVEVSLRPKPFDVLTYLVQHHGRIVSKTELIDAVWSDAAVTDNSLAQCLLEIRRALDDDAQRLIRTVAKRGYLFVSPVLADSGSADGTVVGESAAVARTLADAAEAAPRAANVTAAAGIEPASPRRRYAWIACGLAAAIAVYLAARIRPTTPDGTSVVRFAVAPPGRWTPPMMMAISPDGKHLAFVATDTKGMTMLWLRDVDAVEPHVVSDTVGADMPFWSPDGAFVAFRSGSLLKKVNLTTRSVQTITDHVAGFGGTWGRDDVIVFRSDLAAGLSRVSASGGTPTLAIPDTPTRTLLWPRFITDGEHLLVFVRSMKSDERGIYVGSIDSPTITRVLSSEIEGLYAPGYVLTVRDERLVAYTFDAERLQIRGEPLLIAEGVLAVEGAAHAGVSVSENGVLTYLPSAFFDTQLSWFNREGHRLSMVGTPQRYAAQMPQISPDGRRLAIARGIYSREDIWLIDLLSSASTRFTFDPARDATPMWSIDATRIVFESNRGDGRARLYQKQTTGSGSEDLLFATDDSVHVQDWSADGRYIVYMTANARTHADLWVLPLFGARRPTPFAATIAGESQAQISPDGRWMAYTSDETGRDEVYVQSFPSPGSKHQVTTDGGVMPRWRKDMGEMFFIDAHGQLNSVAVRAGASIELGPATPMFQTDIPFWGVAAIDWRALYAPSSDGQQFLINGRPDTDPPLTLVVNWTAGIKR